MCHRSYILHGFIKDVIYSQKASHSVYFHSLTHSKLSLKKQKLWCAVKEHESGWADVDRKFLQLANRWRGNPDVSLTTRPIHRRLSCKKDLQTFIPSQTFVPLLDKAFFCHNPFRSEDRDISIILTPSCIFTGDSPISITPGTMPPKSVLTFETI